MSRLDLARYAAAWCAASVMFAGCGGSPSQIGPAVAMPQNAIVSRLETGRSWMAPEAKAEDLLYVSDIRNQTVNVYSYPQGGTVGKLTGFGRPKGECADAAGNVWIADAGGSDVIEYPHGGSNPIVALDTPGSPTGCSVDPLTGNLAVTGGTNGIVLSIYRHTTRGGWRSPVKYAASNIHAAYFCGYDGQGNLFVDGVNGGQFQFAELSRGGTLLKSITLNQSIAVPAQVQWDGHNVAVGDSGTSPSVIYQFSINGSAGTEIGSTTLDGTKSVRQFWIQGDTVVAPSLNGHDVGLFNYPAGGSPTGTIEGVRAFGAAVSLAQ
jgi:hypothetical protein